MVELSPANIELGLELPVCRPLMELLEAPCTSAWPLDAGRTLRQMAEPAASLLVQHMDASCCLTRGNAAVVGTRQPTRYFWAPALCHVHVTDRGTARWR